MPRQSHRLLIVLLGLAIWLGFALGRYPGELNPDSEGQIAQALSGKYDDWHPPVMARLWSLLLPLGAGPAGTMFVAQILCWGLAFTLLALALERLGHRLGAWAVFLVGLFPPFLMQIVYIHKDVGLVASLMLAVALVARFRLAGERLPPWAAVAASLLVLYAGLVRANGWFAAIPLAVWMVWPRALRRPVLAVLACGLAALVMTVPANMINRDLLGARPAGAIRSLQLFDLAGIAHFSRDTSVMDDKITLEALDACYSPVIADTFYHGNRCGFVWDRIAGRPDTPSGLASDVPDAASIAAARLGWPWLAAIARHPLAWAQHRVLHFNAAMQFLVPSHQAAIPAIHALVDGKEAKLPAPQGMARIMDIVRFGPWATPALWLALGLGVLVITHDARRRGDALATLSLALTLSGLAYLGAFLFVGVANDPRYGLTGGAAILTATALLIPGLRDDLSRVPARYAIAVVLLLATCTAMLAYRASVPDALYGG